MNATDQSAPTPPDGARILEVGETIRDGDLHWNGTVRHWVAVTPQGDERVESDESGFYCRTNDDL